MKEQLEALAQEMIQEIKDLKDLTKKELPEIAKEYIRYNMITSLIGTLSFFVISIICIALVNHGVNAGLFSYLIFGGIGITLSVFFFFMNLCDYLSFKMQPRRKAIEAVTQLFK